MMPDLSIGYFNQSIRGIQDVDGVPKTFGSGDRFTGVQAGIALPLWICPVCFKSKGCQNQ